MNGKMAKWATLGAMGLLSLLFLMAGGSKVTGSAEMIQTFERFGLPIALMYFIGVCEMAGAVGLWLNVTVVLPWSLRRLAALGLAIIMVGAITMHILNDPVVLAIPAAVALVLLLFLLRKFGQAADAEI